MAGLAAAWSLSGARSRDEFEVTVYQRGWRLGGKAASSRGVNGRIEEHGLHVWLGYYDNAFRLMREVYDELDRATGPIPACPIATWRDAFAPAERVGVGDGSGDDWSHWVATFARTTRSRGVRRPRASAVRRGVRARGLRPAAGLLRVDPARQAAPEPAGVVLSGLPDPPPADGARTAGRLGAVLRQAEIAAMVGAVEAIRLLETALPRGGPLAATLLAYLEGMRDEIAARLRRQTTARRAAELADLVITCLRGRHPRRTARSIRRASPPSTTSTSGSGWRGTARDPTRWSRRSCAGCTTSSSPTRTATAAPALRRRARPVPGRRDCSSSTGARSSGGCRPAAGTSSSRPLYQALRARGVRFAFFHRVDRCTSRPTAPPIEASCWGDRPSWPTGAPSTTRSCASRACRAFRRRRAASSSRAMPPPTSSLAWADRSAGEQLVLLRAARTSTTSSSRRRSGWSRMSAASCSSASPRWREMVDRVATVPTQSLQLWLREDEAGLGWRHPGATVSGVPRALRHLRRR